MGPALKQADTSLTFQPGCPENDQSNHDNVNEVFGLFQAGTIQPSAFYFHHHHLSPISCYIQYLTLPLFPCHLSPTITISPSTSSLPHPSSSSPHLPSSAPAHTIANFTVCALKCSLPSSIPPEVVEAFILVCRQCYNTCDGLLVLKEYTLHKHIAAAMTKVTHYTDTLQLQ